ncbi:MAG: hypothetical protein ABW190_15495 [Rhizobacter sp.]
MATSPEHLEIDHRTIKLIVGIIAISLATLTSFFSTTTLTSISAAYYEGGWSQVIFIGFLFAIGALMLAYNGYTRTEMVLCKVAAIAALCIAMFPCKCVDRVEIIKGVHGGAAIVMFLILAYLCWGFYHRAQAKAYAQAKRRAKIYVLCGVAMLLAIAAMAYETFTQGAISVHMPRFVFYGEAVGLIAFGISWLTASRTIPGLTAKEERFSPLRPDNPQN